MCDFTSVEPTGRHAIAVEDPVDFFDMLLGQIGTDGTCIQNDPNNFQVDNLDIYISALGHTISGTLNTLQFSFDSNTGYWSLYTKYTPSGGTAIKNTVEKITCSKDGHRLKYSGTYSDGSALKVTQWAGLGLHFDGINVCEAGFSVPKGVPCTYDVYFKNANVVEGDDLIGDLNLTGRILGPNGNGVADFNVEVWDKDRILKDDHLGSVYTNPDGSFSIPINKQDHKEWIFDQNPDLYFKVYKGISLVHSTEDSVMWNVNDSKHVEISLKEMPK